MKTPSGYANAMSATAYRRICPMPSGRTRSAHPGGARTRGTRGPRARSRALSRRRRTSDALEQIEDRETDEKARRRDSESRKVVHAIDRTNARINER